MSDYATLALAETGRLPVPVRQAGDHLDRLVTMHVPGQDPVTGWLLAVHHTATVLELVVRDLDDPAGRTSAEVSTIPGLPGWPSPADTLRLTVYPLGCTACGWPVETTVVDRVRVTASETRPDTAWTHAHTHRDGHTPTPPLPDLEGTTR